MSDTCSTCRFFVAGHDGKPETIEERFNGSDWTRRVITQTLPSRCHRRAPGPYHAPDGTTGHGWPVVDAGDWCGEHENSNAAILAARGIPEWETNAMNHKEQQK